MFPILFSIGKFSISSFGAFLALGFLFGVLLVWRLSRAWDLDEEKILDLTLLTFIGGLIGARIYFGIDHLQFFASNPLRIILFTKYPGFSFWGGFLGGWLTMYYFVRRQRGDFWQIADIAAIGFLGGLILSNFGCFLGGCNIGSVTKSFFGVSMVGAIGKRWPVQLFEALLFSLVLLNIWSKAIHFHQRGTIISLSLIYIGAIDLIVGIIKERYAEGYIFSSILMFLGLTLYYKVTRRNPAYDLKNFTIFLKSLFTDNKSRELVLLFLKRTWYNQKITIAWQFRNLKKILRRFNVRFSPKNN